jgi:ferrous iron transport protein A
MLALSYAPPAAGSSSAKTCRSTAAPSIRQGVEAANVLANESESQYLRASLGSENMPAAALLAGDGTPSGGAQALGAASVGFKGRIRAVKVRTGDHGLSAAELERRLIELGFVEGARVEVLHQGLFGRDPIAVRVNETTVALRRREAAAILVEPDGG